MFGKVLIANRGEIACRVIATARRLGMATVAVHSDADEGAKHVAMADEAVWIGSAPAADSYLRIDRVLEAATRTGAEAVHPGYGFLSENPDFVETVEAAGLVFIGPPSGAIRAMGLKDAAKTLMQRAGVPVVPGYHGAAQDPDVLAAEAERIGYPILIKARAGGGGKGMRRVDAPKDFANALASARREAEASFGDAACLVERFIPTPRHVEIQVFADSQGNALHLFERDCSVQRRHQKVIEEAPAPGMTDAVRAAMGAAAVEAARAIGYRGAGTVEFIADGSRGLRPDGFWFMEMNTRLQVEHPVTEAITGLDLVDLQFRVAAGHPLPVTQDDLAIHGHAVEARVYAEDAAAGFLPTAGRLAHLSTPDASAFQTGGLRVDSGVREGDRITPYYDPMIAKVIAHAPTRAGALSRLRGALSAIHVAGCVTNLAFLHTLLGHTAVVAGRVDTGLIDRDRAALTAIPPPGDLVLALAGLVVLGFDRPDAGPDPWERLRGWRHWEVASHPVTLLAGEIRHDLMLWMDGPGRYAVDLGQATIRLKVAFGEDGTATVTRDGLTHRARALRHGRAVTVFLDGQVHVLEHPDPLAAPDDLGDGGDLVMAPMPGLLRLVQVAAGDRVSRGDPVFVLEAMKMEHTLTAPRDGVVDGVLADAGDQVAEGAVLMRMTAEAIDG